MFASLVLKWHCIEFKYYPDGIHSGLTPPGNNSLVFDANGVHPDPARIDDIRSMMKPSNADELREFLGIATNMSPFIPKLSANTATLRDLIKEDAVFAWNWSHDKAFESTKKLICREVDQARR